MKKIDYIIIVILAIGGIWSLFLPNKIWQFHEISSKKLHYELTKADRYFNTEDVAQAIIEKNPTILLIDVRDTNQYKAYTLPGAMNIPYDSLLSPTNEGILRSEGIKKIFFSNGTTLADQAWMITKRAGLNGFYVMKGGMNAWFDNILNPTLPVDPSFSEDKLYQRRKGLSAFFVGSSADQGSSNTPAPNTIQVQPIKKNASLGGCG